MQPSQCRARHHRAQIYSCHAGVCDGIVLLHADGLPPMYLMFGKFVDVDGAIACRRAAERLACKNPARNLQIMDNYNRLPRLTASDVEDIKMEMRILADHLRPQTLIGSMQTNADQILQCMQANDFKLSVEQMCSNMGVSRRQLYAIFAREFNLTPHVFLRRERIVRAQALLKQGTPLAQVAIAVGFGNYSSFVRAFEAVTGQTPHAYRKMYRVDAH